MDFTWKSSDEDEREERRKRKKKKLDQTKLYRPLNGVPGFRSLWVDDKLKGYLRSWGRPEEELEDLLEAKDGQVFWPKTTSTSMFEDAAPGGGRIYESDSSSESYVSIPKKKKKKHKRSHRKSKASSVNLASGRKIRKPEEDGHLADDSWNTEGSVETEDEEIGFDQLYHESPKLESKERNNRKSDFEEKHYRQAETKDQDDKRSHPKKKHHRPKHVFEDMGYLKAYNKNKDYKDCESKVKDYQNPVPKDKHHRKSRSKDKYIPELDSPKKREHMKSDIWEEIYKKSSHRHRHHRSESERKEKKNRKSEEQDQARLPHQEDVDQSFPPDRYFKKSKRKDKRPRSPHSPELYYIKSDCKDQAKRFSNSPESKDKRLKELYSKRSKPREIPPQAFFRSDSPVVLFKKSKPKHKVQKSSYYPGPFVKSNVYKDQDLKNNNAGSPLFPSDIKRRKSHSSDRLQAKSGAKDRDRHRRKSESPHSDKKSKNVKDKSHKSNKQRTELESKKNNEPVMFTVLDETRGRSDAKEKHRKKSDATDKKHQSNTKEDKSKPKDEKFHKSKDNKRSDKEHRQSKAEDKEPKNSKANKDTGYQKSNAKDKKHQESTAKNKESQKSKIHGPPTQEVKVKDEKQSTAEHPEVSKEANAKDEKSTKMNEEVGQSDVITEPQINPTLKEDTAIKLDDKINNNTQDIQSPKHIERAIDPPNKVDDPVHIEQGLFRKILDTLVVNTKEAKAQGQTTHQRKIDVINDYGDHFRVLNYRHSLEELHQPKNDCSLQDEQTPEKIAQAQRETAQPVYLVTGVQKGKAVAGSSKGNHKPVSAAPTTKGAKLSKSKVKKKSEGDEDKLTFDITDFDSYYKWIHGTDIVEPPERDSEWLDLSDTDEEAEKQKIQSLKKEPEKWMLEGISIESQTLVSEMKLFHYCTLFMGRSFFSTIPNFTRGHMDFVSKRSRIIPLLISACFLFFSLVLCVQAFIDIRSDGSENVAVLIEQLELTKYTVSVTFVISNLLLAAIWSVLVILRDGELITSYMNDWCAATTAMETAGALDIKWTTGMNLFIWFCSCSVIIVCFIFDKPANVRGTCGLISMLVFRGLVPEVRLRIQEEYQYFQVFGLFFIMYVLYCSRMLFTLMQIVSLIIKNTAEMWNYKFALTFSQFGENDHGVTRRIRLNLPTVNFFPHHRMITTLLKRFGEVFAAPISIYMVVHMAVITSTLVWLFNFTPGKASDHRNQVEIIYDYIDSIPPTTAGPIDSNRSRTTPLPPVVKNVSIPYYHAPVDEVMTSLFVLVHTFMDFVFTTETISAAGQSFFDGFEFVRRTNLILAQNTHERRVVQSLLWSFSSTQPSILSANRFFPVGRPTVMAGLGTSIFFFSLIIQLQSKKKDIVINIDRCVTIVNNITTFSKDPRCDEINKQHGKKDEEEVITVKRDYFMFFEHCLEGYEEIINSDLYLPKKDKPFIIKRDLPFTVKHLPMCIINIKIDDFGIFRRPFYRRLEEDEALEYITLWDRDPFQSITAINRQGTVKGEEWCSYEDTHQGTTKVPTKTSCALSDTARDPNCPRCTWLEFYRDCFTSCYSEIHQEYFVIPAVLEATPGTTPATYKQHFKYARKPNEVSPQLDCGVNPYAYKDSTLDLIDCLGNKLENKFDSCGFHSFYYPDPERITRSITRWRLLNAAPKVPFLKDPVEAAKLDPDFIKGKECFDDKYTARKKCEFAKYGIYCGFSKLPGIALKVKDNERAYWHGDWCNKYVLKYPASNTGFCRSEIYFLENVDASGADMKKLYQENSVTPEQYKDVKNKQWEAEFDGRNYPCTGLTEEDMKLGMNKFAFLFTCPDKEWKFEKNEFYRPYYRTEEGNLKQIPFDYEQDDPTKISYKELCTPDHPYPPLPFEFTDASYPGETFIVTDYYGCHGHKLIITDTTGFTEDICLKNWGKLPIIFKSKDEVNCEADIAIFYTFPDDCKDNYRAKVTSEITKDIVKYQVLLTGVDAEYDMCRFEVPRSKYTEWEDELKRNGKEKIFRQISPEWYKKQRKVWDKWNKDSQVYEIQERPATSTQEFCGKQSTLGPNLPLGFKLSNPSKPNLKLCSWEASYRDCYRPCKSEYLKKWIWMPVWIDAKTRKPFKEPRLYETDCAFEAFFIAPEKDAIRCDEGWVERTTGTINDPLTGTQKDNCGWVYIPEFDLKHGEPSTAVQKTTKNVDKKWYKDDGSTGFVSLACYNTFAAQERCQSENIFPYCEILKDWKHEHGKFIDAYRFGEKHPDPKIGDGCVSSTNISPNSEGFCKVLFPEKLIEIKQDIVMTVEDYDEKQVGALWKSRLEEFEKPPCNDIVHKIASTRMIQRRYLQYHCMELMPIGTEFYRKKSSLYYPMYKTLSSLPPGDKEVFKFVPFEILKDSFETNCDYPSIPAGGLVIVPGVKIMKQTEFLGCHGQPLWKFPDSAHPDAFCAYLPNYPELSSYCEIELDEFYFLFNDCEDIRIKNHPAFEKLTTPIDYGMCTIKAPKIKTGTANQFPFRRMVKKEYQELLDFWGDDEKINAEYNKVPKNPCFLSTFTEKDCGWFQQLKLHYRPCDSPIMGRHILVNIQMYKKESSPDVYAVIPEIVREVKDCAIQPFFTSKDLIKIKPIADTEIYLYDFGKTYKDTDFDECGWKTASKEWNVVNRGSADEKVILTKDIDKPKGEQTDLEGLDKDGKAAMKTIRYWSHNEVETERIKIKEIRKYCQWAHFSGSLGEHVTYGEYCYKHGVGPRTKDYNWAGYCIINYPDDEVDRIRKIMSDKVPYNTKDSLDMPIMRKDDFEAIIKIHILTKGDITKVPFNYYKEEIDHTFGWNLEDVLRDKKVLDNMIFKKLFLFPCIQNQVSPDADKVLSWNYLLYYRPTDNVYNAFLPYRPETTSYFPTVGCQKAPYPDKIRYLRMDYNSMLPPTINLDPGKTRYWYRGYNGYPMPHLKVLTGECKNIATSPLDEGGHCEVDFCYKQTVPVCPDDL